MLSTGWQIFHFLSIVSGNAHFNSSFLFHLFLAKSNKIFLACFIQKYPRGKCYGRHTVHLHIQLGIWHKILRTAMHTSKNANIREAKDGANQVKKTLHDIV